MKHVDPASVFLTAIGGALIVSGVMTDDVTIAVISGVAVAASTAIILNYMIIGEK